VRQNAPATLPRLGAATAGLTLCEKGEKTKAKECVNGTSKRPRKTCKEEYGPNAGWDLTTSSCFFCPENYTRTGSSVKGPEACKIASSVESIDAIFKREGTGPKSVEKPDDSYNWDLIKGIFWKCPEGSTSTIFSGEKKCVKRNAPGILLPQ
jgi:hypothetical protein